MNIDDVGRTQDCGALDYITQFPDVPRPGVASQRIHGLVAEAPEYFVILRTKEIQHASCHGLHFVRAISQWRQVDLDDIQSIVQVFPETPLLDRFIQIRIRSGNDADVGFSGLLIAHTLVFTILDEPQKLGLDR